MSKRGTKRLTSVWVETEDLQSAQRLARGRGTTLSAMMRLFISKLSREEESISIAQRERFQCRPCDKSVYANSDDECIECGNYVIPNP